MYRAPLKDLSFRPEELLGAARWPAVPRTPNIRRRSPFGPERIGALRRRGAGSHQSQRR